MYFTITFFNGILNIGDTMQEKIDELYRKYLIGRLDMIFNEDSDYSVVYHNNKYNKYISLNIEYESNGETKDNIRKLFHPDYYYNQHTMKYCLIIDGIKTDIGFDHISYLNGCAVVSKNGKENFVYTTGELLSDIWFDKVYQFSCGLAKVKRDGKINFIDTKGNLLSDTWYDFDNVDNFINGFSIVEKNNKYNYLDTNGKLLSDTWYDHCDIFLNGYAIIKDNGKMNIIDMNGKIISEIWFSEIESFSSGYAIVKQKNKYNFINKSGNLISDTWYDEVDGFYMGYARVKLNNEWFMIDGASKIVTESYSSKYNLSIINSSFYKKSNESYGVINKDLKGYQVKKIIAGYQCIKNSDNFKIKYEPIKIYGSYILCINKDKVILFDRKHNAYNMIGTIEDIEFDDNFIFDNSNNKVFFMYEEKMIDITLYYNEKLADKRKINISKGLGILSKNSFFGHNEEEIMILIRKEREEDKRNEQERKRLAEQHKLQNAKEMDEKDKLQAKKELEEKLYSIKKLLNELAVLQEKTCNYEKIKVDSLFINVDDHKEINPLYLDLGVLKYIDLSMESFKNAKVSGIDFRECNISFNPQEVYNKDLSNCNFEGLFISPFINFSGVDIRGTRFSRDNNSKTIDIFNGTFKDAIYDDNTTYDGIPFTIIFGKSEKANNQFKL